VNEYGTGEKDPERSAGREAAGTRKSVQTPPVIALCMECLLTWTVERVAKSPREQMSLSGWVRQALTVQEQRVKKP